MRSLLNRFRKSDLARNAGWMTIGQGLSLIVQAAYFVIIVRSLGAQEYGAFVATIAFTQLLSPFVGFGREFLLIKHVALEKAKFPIYYGKLLVSVTATGISSTLVVVALARMVLAPSIHLPVILLVGLAELVFSRLADCTAMAFQAIDRLDVTAQMKVLAALMRLIGIAVLSVAITHPTAGQWAAVYLLTTVAGAMIGLIWVRAAIGQPRYSWDIIDDEFVEGLFFSASSSAQTVYNDIDKTMLSRLSTLDAVGIYAAAYRLIDVAFVPVKSLLTATYQNFFRAGRDGIRGAVEYMRRLIPGAVLFSGVVFFGLIFIAPVLPRLIGNQYARTVEALRWLALLPALKTIHFLLADALTGAGHQRLRTVIQVGVAGFNVLINLWLIAAYSWRGAAWASLATDGLLALSFFIAVKHLNRSCERQPIEPARLALVAQVHQ